jgi:acylphosphatase
MTLRFLISGTVQGVGYRYFVLRRAAVLGLGGWARNLPDGRVEVVARGSREALESLEVRLREGPKHARVTVVDKYEISDDIEATKTFDIM